MLSQAASAFRQRGVEACVLSTGETVGDFASELRRRGLRVFHLPFGRNARFAIGLLRLLWRVRPDVVHVHTERANAAICVVARCSGARVIRSVHSVFTYSGRKRVLRRAERAFLRLLGVRHVSVSRAVEDNERKRLANPTHLIENWIGERFRPARPAERAEARARFGIAGDVFVVVSVGGCSSTKNHIAILQALPSIAARLDRPLVYLHAGTGPNEGEERMHARALQAPIDVRFLGAIEDVRPVLWAADAFCMPSRYEAIGIAALEAAACALPLVLSDVEGLRGVHPETTSVHFKAPSAEGVAEGVGEVLAVPLEELRASGERVADRVRRGRDMHRSVQRLAEIYRG